MNPLDVATPGDVRDALIEGEFKRLVKHDSMLGENEKKHIIASAATTIKLVEQSMNNALYDLPPMPSELFVMNIVSSIFGSVYSYVFADLEHAKTSARWYARYAGWVREEDKDKNKVLEQDGDGQAFVFRVIDTRSGDYVTIGNARVYFAPIVQSAGAA